MTMTVYEFIQQLTAYPGESELVFEVCGEERNFLGLEGEWRFADEVKIKIE